MESLYNTDTGLRREFDTSNFDLEMSPQCPNSKEEIKGRYCPDSGEANFKLIKKEQSKETGPMAKFLGFLSKGMII